MDCVFVLRQPESVDLPYGIRKVKYNTFSYLYEMATAKVWVDNTRKQPQIVKRKGQLYIQTWHGGLPLKKIEKDAVDSLDNEYIKTAVNDSKQIDYLLASSEWGMEWLRRCFWYSGQILKCSSARLDPLFSYNPKIIGDIKHKLKIDEGIKIVLYAPTFRKENSIKAYNIDFEKLTDSMCKRFGGKWITIVKLHPNIAESKFCLPDSVINMSNYPDITDLYLISDILVTDYSSAMFDYSLLNRPVFLYASDIEEYKGDRDLYFDIYALPFVCSENNEELANNIQNFNNDLYKQKLYEFRDNIGLVEDGSGARFVSDLIVEYCNGR